MLEKFAHVFPAMVTPMKEDGSFNYEVAKKHADWMMDRNRSFNGSRRISEYVIRRTYGIC